METLDALIPALAKKALIIGVGNLLRGDDAFGSLAAQRLKGRLVVKVVDAGSAPENYLGSIVKENPDTVLLIDAVDFGGQPGELRLFNLDTSPTRSSFFTHTLTPDFLHAFLQQSTGAHVVLLAVQPVSLRLNDPLGPLLTQELDMLEDWFLTHFALRST